MDLQTRIVTHTIPATPLIANVFGEFQACVSVSSRPVQITGVCRGHHMSCALCGGVLANGRKVGGSRGDSSMADTNAVIADLKREIAELSGLSLATGVILTQLLQKIVSREMSPQNSATQIVNNAREAIEGFTSQVEVDPVMKSRALEAVNQFEEQLRSVLPI
jgi:anthranilate/para-aminobenzoate synthase component II